MGNRRNHSHGVRRDRVADQSPVTRPLVVPSARCALCRLADGGKLGVDRVHIRRLWNCVWVFRLGYRWDHRRTGDRAQRPTTAIFRT